MSMMLRTVLVTAGVVIATQAAAQVTFYEREDFRGRSYTVDRPIGNMDRMGFDDRASSAVIQGGDWQVCEDPGFRGRCAVLHPGEYRSLREVGLNNDVSSVRPMSAPGYGFKDNDRYAQNDQFRRHGDERVFEVPVNAVRAVVGPPEQRCWVERQDVVTNQNAPNVGGAIAGAVIGGVLGHQIGSGRGRDVATAAGAVGGAAVGANVGRGGATVSSEDVQRCTSVPSNAPPDYWDVSYTFRGQVHHVQMSAPPGPTITVNENGEPRM